LVETWWQEQNSAKPRQSYDVLNIPSVSILYRDKIFQKFHVKIFKHIYEVLRKAKRSKVVDEKIAI